MTIKTVTNCPTCGCECKVEVKDGNHKYVSKDKDMILHNGIGIDRNGNNINLCGRQGAATNIRTNITCNKCRSKMHMKKI